MRRRDRLGGIAFVVRSLRLVCVCLFLQMMKKILYCAYSNGAMGLRMHCERVWGANSANSQRRILTYIHALAHLARLREVRGNVFYGRRVARPLARPVVAVVVIQAVVPVVKPVVARAVRRNKTRVIQSEL